MMRHEYITQGEYEKLLEGASRVVNGSAETASGSFDIDYGHDLIEEVLNTVVGRVENDMRERIETALPLEEMSCTKHPDDDVVKCGWKRAVFAVRDAL